MTEDRRIIPPDQLVRQWMDEFYGGTGAFVSTEEAFIAKRAARWGADQELEACVKWLKEQRWEALAIHLRAARRPKPPSLKKRALQAWAAVEAGTDDQTAMAVIRRALEQLDD